MEYSPLAFRRVSGVLSPFTQRLFYAIAEKGGSQNISRRVLAGLRSIGVDERIRTEDTVLGESYIEHPTLCQAIYPFRDTTPLSGSLSTLRPDTECATGMYSLSLSLASGPDTMCSQHSSGQRAPHAWATFRVSSLLQEGWRSQHYFRVLSGRKWFIQVKTSGSSNHPAPCPRPYLRIRHNRSRSTSRRPTLGCEP